MLQCCIDRHNQEEIKGICLNEDCQLPRPSCFFCSTTTHSNHSQKIVQFEIFYEKQEEAKQIKNTLVECIGLLKELVTQFEKLNSKVNISFAQQQTNLSDLHNQANEILGLQFLNDSVRELKKFLDSYKDKSTNHFKKFEDFYSKTLNLRMTQYKFSSNHPRSIINGYKARNFQNEMVPGFKICTPCIPPQGRQHFKFQILECQWVFLGVCQRDTIVSRNYVADLEQPGHGSYLINNYGDAYSSIEYPPQVMQHDNDRFFYKNDIINVSIDFDLKTINWINESRNLSYTMSLPIDQELSPCVALWQSSVEIINVQITK